MGSSRKVRSRVHGGVKETRPWLLFASFPQLRFLPTGGCVQCATVLTPQQPRHRTDRVCFSAFIKSSPGRKTTNITTSLGAGEFSTLHPSWAPWEIFCVCTCEVWCLFISSHVGWLLKAVAVHPAFFSQSFSRFPVFKHFTDFIAKPQIFFFCKIQSSKCCRQKINKHKGNFFSTYNLIKGFHLHPLLFI